MATLYDVIESFEKVDENRLAQETIEESADFMADLNAEQINSGLRADGTEMPDYSLRSVIQYGKPVGPIRLRDTGAWQAGIYVSTDGENVVFSSSDPKDGMLVQRYGSEIEGLSEKFEDEAFREKIEPVFFRKVEEVTGIKT